MNKAKYKKLCETEDTIPIFSQYWWLDAVAGENHWDWDAAIVEKGGLIKAAMPYVIKKQFGLTRITPPSLTQTLGPWIRVSEAKYAKQLAQQKDIMLNLIEQLPKFHYFSQNWHHSRTNWLPFFWKGFKQTTRYTYILPDLNDIDVIWKDIQSNIKREIRKAENRFKLIVRSDVEINDFIKLNYQVFERQNKKPPYSQDFIRKLDQACVEHGARKIFIAEDAQGKQHAGVYIVWNKHSAYYLMGGGDPALRNSGATSLCMWEAIKFSSKVSKQFDFEGSMIEPVERFFRAFGAIQTPYFSISKTPSKLLKSYLFLKDIIRPII